MIYLDVTPGALMPLQTGIPRTTRALWSLLRDSGCRVRPMCWQPFRRRFTRLTRRARRLLEDPASLEPKGLAPRDATLPILYASFADLRFWADKIPLGRILQRSDTLLLTSLFPDNRLGYLDRVVDRPGRKVAIFHDAIPLRDPNVTGWERARHLRALRLLARMDLVIAVSASAQAELTKLWQQNKVNPAPISALPWPVPFTSKRPNYSEPPSTPKRILYVSRLKAVKNHAALFEACEKLWQAGLKFELELIGCEDEARESGRILRQIRSMQHQGKYISWRAQVSEADLHLAYQRASFTVFPSTEEGFGLPVIESLWHGRPVISNDIPPLRELAEAGGCVTVNASNVEQFAAAMLNLLQDSERLSSLARAGYARRCRTWEDYGNDLMPLLAAK